MVLGLLVFATALAAMAAPAADKSYPSVTLWPLVYHYEDSNDSRTDVLWPIYHQKRKGSHTRTAIRPLIFNYETDPERNFRQTNFLWPLTHFEYEGGSYRRWIFPVYYQEENDHKKALDLWPFYGHAKKSDGTESWSTLYPFFQYRQNEISGDFRTDYFWPLGRSYRQGAASGNYFSGGARRSRASPAAWSFPTSGTPRNRSGKKVFSRSGTAPAVTRLKPIFCFCGTRTGNRTSATGCFFHSTGNGKKATVTASACWPRFSL